MKHRSQQKFGKIELDGLSESLPRGLKLVTHVRLCQEIIELHPLSIVQLNHLFQKYIVLPRVTVENISGVLFVHLKLLSLRQLLEAGADGRDLAILRHLQRVLQASDQSDRQLGNVIDVGEYGVQLRVRCKLESLNLFPEHFCDHVQVPEIRLLGHDEILDHFVIRLSCSAAATFKEFSN